MQINRLITTIQEAKQGSRFLDAQIAKCLGWQRGETAQSKGNQVWLRPGSIKPAKVPTWSTNLDEAFKLAQSIYPNHVGGFIWRDGKALAQVGEGSDSVEAADPILALCAAALAVLGKNSASAD